MPLDDTTARACVILWASTLLWLRLFAIQRYAVGLEVLAGILLVQLAASIAPSRRATSAAAALTLCALALTRPAEWWHRPWSDPYAPSPPQSVRGPGTFLLTAQTTGYWASALNPAARFFTMVPMGLATGGVLRDQVVDGIHNPPEGALWTLGFDWPIDPATRANMASYGAVPAGPCVRASSLWWVDTLFCHARRTGPRPLAAADLPMGEAASFTNQGAGVIYEVAGWLNAQADGTATDSATARLVLHPAQPGAVLDITLRSTPGTGETQLIVNGQTLPPWPAPPSAATPWRTLPICLPATEDVADITLQSAATPLGLTLQSIRLRPPAKGECPP